MPRKEARIFTSIWQDGDFIALPSEAQRLYFLLLSQPELSLCGLLTLAENRWAAYAPGMTRGKVRSEMTVLAEAQPRPFILVDYGTDEVLIRSFIRRDHVLRSPKLVRPLVAAVHLVRSPALRTALRDELQAAQGGDPICTEAVEAVEQMIKLLSQVNTLSDRVPDRVPDRVKEIGVVVITSTTDYLERPELDRLCNRLADAIEANGSKRPPVGQAWRDACRLMIDKDGRTEEQIQRAIDWCQADEFWRANVLSMPKLRQQYDKLRLAAQRGKKRSFDLPPLDGRNAHMMRR
jgi:hypothetical protein